MHQQQTAFENIVGKEEIACNEQFLLFPQCFLLNQIIVPHLSIVLTSYFYLVLNWKSPKIGISSKELMHSHTMTPFDAPGKQAF